MRLTAKLYVILGSHACRTGMLLLEHKGIPYALVTVPTGAQRLLPLRGFPGGTVPALVIDGERVQTNRAIARHLERVRPDPPLFPADPAERVRVEEAEEWADEVFQMVARRIGLACALHGEAAIEPGFAAPLGPLLWRRPRMRQNGMRMVGRFLFNVNEGTERKLLAELPGHLDRIDNWIEEGVLNGEELNAADYAIASCLALLTYRPGVRAEIDARPAGRLVARVVVPPGTQSGDRGSSSTSGNRRSVKVS